MGQTAEMFEQRRKGGKRLWKYRSYDEIPGVYEAVDERDGAEFIDAIAELWRNLGAKS